MQVFLTNASWEFEEIERAVRWLDDKRLQKMCTETMQIVSDAMRRHGEELPPYKAYNTKAPWPKWASRKGKNMTCLILYLCELLREYTYRTGKEHKSGRYIEEVKDWIDMKKFMYHVADNRPIVINDSIKNKVATYLPSRYRNCQPHEWYRALLVYKWIEADTKKPTWTNREPPKWYIHYMLE